MKMSALIDRFPGLPAGGIEVTGDVAKNVLSERGAYLIFIQLERPVLITARTIGAHTLAPACYIYAGSARGPGGLGARIGRHLRRDKKCHWHIDQLTTKASDLEAYAYVDGVECDLIKVLLETGSYEFPVPGFGSTDCRICKSHLLLLKQMASTDDL